MSTNYAMDQSWNMQNQYNPSQQIQLEEEYYGSVSGQAHPQQPGLAHNISYPLTTPGPYRANPINFSQRPAAQRSLGNQPYGTNGINGNTFDHNGQDLFANPQAQSAAFNRTPNGTNGYYHNPSLPYHPPYPGEVQGPTTPATGLAPEPLVVDTTIDGSLTPGRQFSTSPMSLPLTFGSQDQSQGQAQYHTEVQNQQQFQFNMRPSSDGGPGGGHDSEHSHTIKRARADEEEEYGFGIDVGMDHEGGDGDGKDSGKAKPLGACARCKSLKVKCEFKTAEDPCKRCMNAGKDCVIPGRKKRRTPPKREHLLTQIREQANQISKLMAQLESTKRQPKPITANLSAISHSSPAADLHSPLDPTSPDSQSPAATADVEEWISRARQSIEAFGGFIGAGGAGMMKSFLVDEDPEDSGSSGDDYEFALEDEDGETGEVENYNSQDAGLDMDKRRSSSREKESVSGNSVGSGVPRKKDSGGTQKLATLPSEAVPFGLIANLSLKHSRRKSSSNVDDEDDVGVANEDFFRPSPTPDPMRSSMLGDNRQAPHILIRGIVTPDEAEMLFRIFFDNMGLSISLLDPVLYTAQKTCWRSPFLFTVICAVASRYYTEKPELYPALMNYAQLAAGTALISGQKSIEMCQAYILLSLYPVPARRWEDDRSWIYLGLAIRIAVDLNIHLPNTAKPMNEQHAREMLNRTRVWLNCFNLDRSTGSQYGKKPIIDNADFVANHSGHWWESSEYNMKNFDIQICGYNAELRVMAEFVKKIYSNPQHPTGLNKDVDLQLLAIETDDKLKSLGDIWMARLDQTDQTDPQNRFRTGLLRLAYSYARLAALSFGFQHAFGKNKLDENPFLSRCLAAAFDVVHTYVNDVGRPAQRIYLRHGPEAQSVFATFACAFLVKLLQPKFAEYLSREKRLEIRSQIEKVADLLGSPEVAIDDRHGPKLYSRFLKGLLATPIASVDAFSPTGVTSTKSLPQRRSTRKQKSGSGLTPDSERSFELSPTNGTNLTSPISPSALSPPPEAAFDVFAPMTGYYPPVTSQTQYASRASASPSVGDPTSMNTSDWFPTPLPFDSELVQSMQSVQEMWSQDVSMPGFNWMNNFQANNNDIYMQSDPAGGAMFDPRLYNIKTPPP